MHHEAGMRVPLADGGVALADRWWPADLRRGPVVLVRSPYGRRVPWAAAYARPLARRLGATVVVASVRGTSSRHEVPTEPFVTEAADGAATVEWLRGQPFFDGRLAVIGLSYLGYAAWALAAGAPPELRAVVAQVAPHDMGPVVWPGGALSLADSARWAQLVGGPWRHPGPAALVGARRRGRALDAALAPGADPAAASSAPWWHDWVTHPAPDPYWAPYDQGAALEAVTVPVLVQAGWHDLFRRASLHQHATLRARGVPVGLTVGPFTHAGIGRHWPRLLAEAAGFIGDAFAGRTPAAAGRVRTAVLGTRPTRWRSWPSWPPPSTPRPVAIGRASIVADPADPAPSAGGALLGPGAGAVDQAAVEARPDVAVATGPHLAAAFEVAGTVTAHVDVDADGPHLVVVRLCDVDREGRSTNVCDGVAWCGGGPAQVEVDLGPVAARWAAGHRVRVQVTGGAHPRYVARVRTDGPVTIRVLGGEVLLPVVAGDVPATSTGAGG